MKEREPTWLVKSESSGGAAKCIEGICRDVTKQYWTVLKIREAKQKFLALSWNQPADMNNHQDMLEELMEVVGTDNFEAYNKFLPPNLGSYKEDHTKFFEGEQPAEIFLIESGVRNLVSAQKGDGLD